MTINSRYVRSYHYKRESGVDYTWLIDNRMKILTPYIFPHMMILEIGCGEGLLGERIIQKTSAKVYGIDISPSGIKLAKKRGIKAIASDLNNTLPFPDNCFDVIFSDQVYEHVFKTDYLTSEIYRILKPSGIVLTVTPNLTFWLNRVLFTFGIYPMFLEVSESSKLYGTGFLKKYIQDKKAMGHIHVFTLHALTDMFIAHGFSVVRVAGSPFPWKLPKYILILYNALDRFLALFPSLGRDIIVIAKKPN